MNDKYLSLKIVAYIIEVLATLMFLASVLTFILAVADGDDITIAVSIFIMSVFTAGWGLMFLAIADIARHTDRQSRYLEVLARKGRRKV